jgi:hypothetical protein
MTLPLPSLDDRTFADLVEEGRTLIRTYQPRWTNYNPSDPGITLIELFAWLAEMLIYRADQVPDRHRLVFLRLLNGPGWTPEPSSSVDDEIAATLTALRSRYRAVTVDDHTALAREASPSVARALSLPHRDLGAADDEGRLSDRPGYVSIVVLPPEGVSEDDAAALRKTVGAYLEPRRLLTTQHVIAEPVWAPVSAEVLVARRSDVPDAQARDSVAGALTRFLDPLHGGLDGTGWPFGRDVYTSELYSVLEALPEIDYIPDIQLESSCAAGSKGRCAEAQPLWNEHGDQVGLRLAPHHLPQAAVDPDDIVVSAFFVPVQATVTLTPAAGVTSAATMQAAKAALRILFHPLHGGPTGRAPWSIGSDRALQSLRRTLAGKASGVGLVFAGDPSRVTTDERKVITVQLGERELADLQTEIVLS